MGRPSRVVQKSVARPGEMPPSMILTEPRAASTSKTPTEYFRRPSLQQDSYPLRSSRSASPVTRQSLTFSPAGFPPGSHRSLAQPSRGNVRQASPAHSVGPVRSPSNRLIGGPPPVGLKQFLESREAGQSQLEGHTENNTSVLPTRYSTGSWVAPPPNQDGSLTSQTREANEAAGNAVVTILKTRLEEVRNALNESLLASENQDIDASHITAAPSASPRAESERTWSGRGIPDQAQEGEEEFFMDEFSWDVYEAAAVLAERIKSAGGLALFRDAMLMSEFSELYDESTATREGASPGGVARREWAAAGTGSSPSQPAALSRSESAPQPGDSSQQKAPVFASASDTQRGGAAASESQRGEEVSPDTATLAPPRVSGADESDGQTLLVGASEMEETWVLIDGFRVRVEMLPGGLLPERDTIFEELNFLLSGLQNWEPGGEAWHSMPSFLQLSEMVRFSERVREIEDHYLRWAEDANAAPFDDASKQRVCDWLGSDGEKDFALENLRAAGARRCKGGEAEPGSTCQKLLRYEMYKSNLQRCPLCKKPSKKAKAASANLRVGREPAQPPAPVEGRRRPGYENTLTLIEVEARELAFAVYCGEMNTYYRALVLPSDIEFGREMNTPVTVAWVDGDQRFRQVPPLEVILLTDPWAQAAAAANVAHWDNSRGCLMPGGDADAELLNGVGLPS